MNSALSPQLCKKKKTTVGLLVVSVLIWIYQLRINRLLHLLFLNPKCFSAVWTFLYRDSLSNWLNQTQALRVCFIAWCFLCSFFLFFFGWPSSSALNETQTNPPLLWMHLKSLQAMRWKTVKSDDVTAGRWTGLFGWSEPLRSASDHQRFGDVLPRTSCPCRCLVCLHSFLASL